VALRGCGARRPRAARAGAAGPAASQASARATAGRARGAGMLLERLNGRSPAKVVGAKNFHDIGYLRDLLFNVFTALDVGQRRVGAAPAAAPLARAAPSARSGRGRACVQPRAPCRLLHVRARAASGETASHPIPCGCCPLLGCVC